MNPTNNVCLGEVRQINITQPDIAHLVYTLQQLSYRFEADLIGTDQIPPLMETPDELSGCGETFLGWVINDTIAGCVSYKYDAENRVIDIHRMMIHPGYFRQGIAKRLLAAVEQVEPTAQKAVVSTGADNTPAVHLYLRNGYRITSTFTVPPGISITAFEKILK